MLDLLVKLFEERKIFRRKRKDWKIKALAIPLYFAGLSYRKTSKILRDFAIDETKVKLENEQIYVRNAIDVDDGTILAVHVSTTRTSFEAYYFLRRLLDTCENKPLILVDIGPWYR